MENRIDDLFKKRLGGALSSEIPTDKAAMLDALSKPKRKFRFWILIPLFILLGGVGLALYNYEQKNGNVGSTNKSNPLEKELEFSAAPNSATGKEDPIQPIVNSSKDNHLVLITNRDKTNDLFDPPKKDINQGYRPNEYWQNEGEVIELKLEDKPNDHSVDSIALLMGHFTFDPSPFGSFAPIDVPSPVWTITARGLFGGAFPVFGNISSVGGELRNSYESMGLTYGAELGIERTFGKWRMGSGIGAMHISNKVEYPILESNTEVTVDSTMWTIITISYYEVDSTFNPLLGNWTYDTTYFSEVDSIGMDTSWVELAQVANGSLQRANGRNSISVISIPLQLQYKLFETDKLGSMHALGGVQWVYAYRRRGYFVNDVGQDLMGLSEDGGFKRMNIHLNIGLDWRYPFTDQLFTTVQPVLNYSVLDWQSGYDQRFITPMLKFGVGWRLK
ncbi:MAG: hypothetical protein RL204_190 [Bacteroidota bacterium]|jgi:hypothetical protein